MKTINRTLHLLAVAGLAATVLLSQAVASPIVRIVPDDQTIPLGGTATVDIIVSGLIDPVGGFSFELLFPNGALMGITYTNDPDGKMGAAPLDLSGGFTGAGGSPLDIFFVADAAETEASLSASEGVSFRLATIDLKGLLSGPSNVLLSNVVLSNWDGTADLAGVETVDGRICVETCDRNGAPEPATLLLFGGALSALGIIRRRKQAA